MSSVAAVTASGSHAPVVEPRQPSIARSAFVVLVSNPASNALNLIRLFFLTHAMAPSILERGR